MKHLLEIIAMVEDGELECATREEFIELAGSEEKAELLAAMLAKRIREIGLEIGSCQSLVDQLEAHERDGTEPPDWLIE